MTLPGVTAVLVEGLPVAVIQVLSSDYLFCFAISAPEKMTNPVQ